MLVKSLKETVFPKQNAVWFAEKSATGIPAQFILKKVWASILVQLAVLHAELSTETHCKEGLLIVLNKIKLVLFPFLKSKEDYELFSQFKSFNKILELKFKVAIEFWLQFNALRAVFKDKSNTVRLLSLRLIVSIVELFEKSRVVRKFELQDKAPKLEQEFKFKEINRLLSQIIFVRLEQFVKSKEDNELFSQSK